MTRRTGWVLVFAVLALAGLLIALFVPRRRIWVKAYGAGRRAWCVEYAGLARGEDPALEAAAATFADRHARRRRMPGRKPAPEAAPPGETADAVETIEKGRSMALDEISISLVYCGHGRVRGRVRRVRVDLARRSSVAAGEAEDAPARRPESRRAGGDRRAGAGAAPAATGRAARRVDAEAVEACAGADGGTATVATSIARKRVGVAMTVIALALHLGAT